MSRPSREIRKPTESDCSVEAQFEYRCRRCGAVYRNPCCSPDLARGILVEVALHGFGGDAKKGGRVYAHATHGCKDGGEGIADLIGYRVTDTLNTTISDNAAAKEGE